MKRFPKPFILSAVLGTLFLSAAALADDEVCVVNTTSTPVEVYSNGTNKQEIANNAFCISVNLADDNPSLTDGGVGIWVLGPDNTQVELDIDDPVIGDLGFSTGGNDFSGANIGGGLHMSGAQKGDDGVYRLIIQPQ